jgi:hypothetical protein
MRRRCRFPGLPNDYSVQRLIAATWLEPVKRVRYRNAQVFQLHPEQRIKYLCLGYIEENKWESLSRNEQEAMIEECFAYDDELKKNGHSYEELTERADARGR